MASTILSVTVFKGLAPEPISLRLSQGAQTLFQTEKDRSFKIKFEKLLPGFTYTLLIRGKNPRNEGAFTTFDLTTDEISLLIPDDSHVEEKGDQYLVTYVFTV